MMPSAPIVAYPALACALLLTASNFFRTFAWCGHLKHLQAEPWWVMTGGEPVKLDYQWAGLCLLGAVYFIFR